jgi:hypothetical protein
MSNSISRSGYPSSTATAHVMAGLALHGYTPDHNEPDPREMPDQAALEGLASALMSALAGVLSGTGLEPEIQDLSWSLVDIFHRKSHRLQKRADDAELKLREAQEQNDGSEIASVQLERAQAFCEQFLARRDTIEDLRDALANEYQSLNGTHWRPLTTSMVNHRKRTGSLVQSRDFLAAKRYAETNVMIPPGDLVLFSGGQDCNDIDGIFKDLDQVFARRPQMVLGHSDNPRGADRIAESWAKSRGVPVVAFRLMPRFKGDQSAPFKRNDRMLDANPVGVIVYPGNGINYNLADKAKKLGFGLLDRTGRNAPGAA